MPNFISRVLRTLPILLKSSLAVAFGNIAGVKANTHLDSPLSNVKTMETHYSLWQPSPAKLTFADDEVHVWRATLDLPSLSVEQLGGLLTADESDRAERFHSEKDQQHFIVGQGLLRIILGRYLRTAPEGLRFYYNHYGKPFLAPEYGLHKLCFNMSHSGGLALLPLPVIELLVLTSKGFVPILSTKR